jgi:hypothetical protein
MMSFYVRIIRKLGRNVIDVENGYLEIQEISLGKVRPLMDSLEDVRNVIKNLDRLRKFSLNKISEIECAAGPSVCSLSKWRTN